MKKFIYYLKLIIKGLGDISMYDSGICTKDKNPYDYIAKENSYLNTIKNIKII